MQGDVNFRLIRAARAHRARAAKLLAEIGLYPGQEMLLQRLSQQDGSTQAELAQQLEIEPATLGRMVQRMERNGLLERRPDSRDARAWRVSLTSDGARLQEQIEQRWQQLADETVADLTPEERRQLDDLLERIVTSLGEPNDACIPPGC